MIASSDDQPKESFSRTRIEEALKTASKCIISFEKTEYGARTFLRFAQSVSHYRTRESASALFRTDSSLSLKLAVAPASAVAHTDVQCFRFAARLNSSSLVFTCASWKSVFRRV